MAGGQDGAQGAMAESAPVLPIKVEAAAESADTPACPTCGGRDHAAALCTRPGGPRGGQAEPVGGSDGHQCGACEPCAWFHCAEGCRYGDSCKFCHLCPPGEMKRRKKQKRELRRLAEAANEAAVEAAQPVPAAEPPLPTPPKAKKADKKGRKAKPVPVAPVVRFPLRPLSAPMAATIFGEKVFIDPFAFARIAAAWEASSRVVEL